MECWQNIWKLTCQSLTSGTKSKMYELTEQTQRRKTHWGVGQMYWKEVQHMVDCECMNTGNTLNSIKLYCDKLQNKGRKRRPLQHMTMKERLLSTLQRGSSNTRVDTTNANEQDIYIWIIGDFKNDTETNPIRWVLLLERFVVDGYQRWRWSMKEKRGWGLTLWNGTD